MILGTRHSLAFRRHRIGATLGRARPRAFTLVECLIYIVVLFVVTALAYEAFFSLLNHHRNIARCTDDILRAVNAGERWRADVRAASAPPSVEQSGADRLLRIAGAGGEIVYVFSGTQVWRVENGRTPDKPLLEFVRNSSMSVESRTYVRAWRWELELMSTRKRVKLRPAFTFYAAEPVWPTNTAGAAVAGKAASARIAAAGLAASTQGSCPP